MVEKAVPAREHYFAADVLNLGLVGLPVTEPAF